MDADISAFRPLQICAVRDTMKSKKQGSNMSGWKGSLPMSSLSDYKNPLQTEKLTDLRHPKGYRDPETIDSVTVQKPRELDKTTKISNRERRGKILKVIGIVLAIAAGCGLLYWIYAVFWLRT